MTESPLIIKRKSHQEEKNELVFKFTPDFSIVDGNLSRFREKAWKDYSALPFPSNKDEAWRRTDIRNLPVNLLRTYSDESKEILSVPNELMLPVTEGKIDGQIILTDVDVSIHIENELVRKGVIFTDLKTARIKHSELIKKLAGKLVQSETDKFAALAFAMSENGIFLYVPKNVKVENPLHSLLWASGEQLAHFSHIIVFIDDGAELTYVHESASPRNAQKESMHSGVMEIFVGKNANLRFVELQSWGENIWNFTHEKINVESNANVDWIFGALGSKLTKNFSDLNLVGEGSTGKMSGFYFTHGHQHLDHDTQQNHLAKNTTSDLLFKGALVGESRSVWQGMIFVSPDASKTDGYQANRNLVLDKRSRADSIPGLEILTDDVRCTHGATVGKIDPEELFYLESRGLPRPDAERLIVEGFFDPIMQRIPFEGVRKRFQSAILEKMQDLK